MRRNTVNLSPIPTYFMDNDEEHDEWGLEEDEWGLK